MSIRKEMLNGVMWSAIEKYSGIFISLLVSGVLARLISPESFGVIAVATVIINFINIFTDMGIGPAIIQRKDLTEKDLNSIFSTTIIMGTTLSIIFFFLSWPIANFYKNHELILICQILSIKLLFASLNIVPQACMLKNKKFKLIAKRTLLLQVTLGIVSVAAAFDGAGIYALLISPVLSGIGIFFYNLKYYPQKIDWGFNLAPLRKIFSFSIYQFLFSFINYFSRNLDTLIIGKYFNLKQLGYYDKSYRLMMIPLQNVTQVITPVMQPILSTLQEDKLELARKYNQIIKLISTLSFPLSIFLFYSGGELIRIVYGDNWNEAIPIFRILSLSLSFQMILSTSGAIYQSGNATKYLFLNGILNTISTVTGFIIAAFYFRTLSAMAWAWNITLFINIFTSYYIIYKLVLKAPIKDVLAKLLVPLCCALTLTLILHLYSYNFQLQDLISLIIKFSLSLVVCLSIIQFTGHYNLKNLSKFKK
jgi:teichuronic acid exporter